MKRYWLRLLVLALVLCLVRACLAQEYQKKYVAQVTTICVEFPRGDSPQAQHQREAVAEWLRSRGDRTADCYYDDTVPYDAQLWFFPYWGMQPSDTYFVAQIVSSGNLATGAVGTYEEPSIVNSWSFTLRPKGSGSSIYRDEHASSLEDGLKRLDKALKKARKYGKSVGRD